MSKPVILMTQTERTEYDRLRQAQDNWHARSEEHRRAGRWRAFRNSRQVSRIMAEAAERILEGAN